ncbi:MAG: helix-turn-helix transcriptional regulator [Desulfuromonadales bacterium]|nr:helix-turn-helix transcriptional regulator [Desulfuromonadales bacterium]
MAIGDRILEIRGETARENFAPQFCISRNTLVNYEKGATSPPADFLNRLLELHPEINPTWLLTGEGPKLRDDAVLEGAALPLDKDLMREIIIGLDPIFESLAKPWPGEKKAQLMLLLHDEVLKGEMEGKEVAKTALRLIKLAS